MRRSIQLLYEILLGFYAENFALNIELFWEK